MSRSRSSLRVKPVLLLLPLLLGLLGIRPASVQAQAGGAAHRIYLPWTLQSHSRIGAEALALAGDRAYLGFGPHLVTYDISRPGQARRIDSSPLVEGRIVHIAVGSDRLFTLSRPDDVEGSGALPDQIPWSILTAFDIADPNRPQIMSGLSWREPNLYASDLSASGRFAYLPMVDSSDSRSVLNPSCCDGSGILHIDATTANLRSAWIEESRGSFFFQTLAFDNRLYAYAYSLYNQSVPLLDTDIDEGVMSFDVNTPASPRYVGAAGLSSAASIRINTSMSLFGKGDHLYQFFGDESDRTPILLPLTLDAQGMPELPRIANPSDPRWVDHLPRFAGLGLDSFHLNHGALNDKGHLFVLHGARDARIISIDVDIPLDAVAVGSFRLSDHGISLGQGGERFVEGTLIGDTGSTLVADPGSDRLFLASGQHGALVEIDSSDPSHLTITGIYPASD